MAVNKVVLNKQTLIDLTSDTVSVDDVAQGKTFHLASGEQGTGTLAVPSTHTVTIAPQNWSSVSKLATVPADWAVAGMSATVSPDEDYTSVYKSTNVQGVYLAQILNGYLIFKSGTGEMLSDTIVMNIIAYEDGRGVIVNSGFVSVETNGISISSDANYTGTLSGNELTVTAITPIFKWEVPAYDKDGHEIVGITGSSASPMPLDELHLVNKVRTIGNGAFQNSSVKKVFVGKQVTTIQEDNPFGNTTLLSEIIFERGRTALLTIKTRAGYSAFGNSAIEKLVVPDYVTIINQSFANCTHLKELRYESTYGILRQDVYNGAFLNATALEECTFTATTPPTINVPANIFGNNQYIFVPYDKLTAYTTATNWVSYASNMYGIGAFTAGATLPTQTTDEAWNLTWYATKADLKAGTNPIMIAPSIFDNEYGEIYCTKTVVA